MKTKRRLLAVLTSLALTAALAPMTAFADPAETPTSYGLYVNGEQFTSEKLTITCGEGTAVFDGESTLTLKNATVDKISDGGYGVINSKLESINIKLEGKNTLDGDNGTNDGIDAAGGCNVTITGEGSLDIVNTYYGTYIGSYDKEGADLTVKDATVTVKDSKAAALWANHDITFDNAKVSVDRASQDNYNGIVSNIGGTVTVKNDSELNVANKASCILLGNGDTSSHAFVLESGNVTLVSTSEEADYGYAVKFQPVTDDGDDKGKVNGKITVNGGTLDVTSAVGGTNLTTDDIVFGEGIGYTKGESLTESGNVVVSKEEHTHVFGDWKVTQQPTIVGAGVETRTCECGEEETRPYGTALTTERASGKNRFATSLEIAAKFKNANGNKPLENIIIASGADFADALSATYLAKVKNAPILITAGDAKAVIDPIYSFISENAVEKANIFIVGGTGVVPDSVIKTLTGKGYSVKRLAGKNRFLTNIEVLKEAGVKDEELLIASGTDYADALSASAVGKPILLVSGKASGMTSDQKAYLKTLSSKKGYVIGGTGAVSTGIENDAKAVMTVERVMGKNRYETSVAVAKKFFTNPKAVAIAYGLNYPDGLCGGPLSIAYGCPLLLTVDSLPDAAVNYAKSAGIKSAVTFGGTTLVSDKTVNKIIGK